MIDYVELNRRINVLKNLYRQYNIQIKPGQGLFDILLEAEKIAKGGNFPDEDDKIKLVDEVAKKDVTSESMSHRPDVTQAKRCGLYPASVTSARCDILRHTPR